jgi:hypothetical protein
MLFTKYISVYSDNYMKPKKHALSKKQSLISFNNRSVTIYFVIILSPALCFAIDVH